MATAHEALRNLIRRTRCICWEAQAQHQHAGGTVDPPWLTAMWQCLREAEAELDVLVPEPCPVPLWPPPAPEKGTT